MTKTAFALTNNSLKCQSCFCWVFYQFDNSFIEYGVSFCNSTIHFMNWVYTLWWMRFADNFALGWISAGFSNHTCAHICVCVCMNNTHVTLCETLNRLASRENFGKKSHSKTEHRERSKIKHCSQLYVLVALRSFFSSSHILCLFKAFCQISQAWMTVCQH